MLLNNKFQQKNQIQKKQQGGFIKKITKSLKEQLIADKKSLDTINSINNKAYIEALKKEFIRRNIEEGLSKQQKSQQPSNKKVIKSQKPRLDPNRFISIYDTTGSWKQHAQDNNLTDRDSVRRFQKEVLGFDDTQADGIWGKNTEAAYEDWKQKNSTPVVETVTTQTVQAPTVYQSTYDYDNADDFKNLGFNDYNSLKSWVKANPDHPFAKDMLERFKDIDLWTQNNIESNLGIKGKYRSGYQGDFYDIRNSMKNYFKDQYNIDKNNEYTTQIQQNINNMNNYVQNLANRFSFLKKQFKNGGQLISRNPITRFKIGG